MSVLATFTQQPADLQDYDIEYADYLSALGDTASDFTVTADDGISVESSALIDTRVKVYVTGGESGKKYKITCTLTTSGGRVKQAEIYVAVKET